MYRLLSCCVILCCGFISFADGPADNIAEKVRRIPPEPKSRPSSEEVAELKKGLDELGKEINSLKNSLKGKNQLLNLLPDVQIYHNAVRYALEHDEIIDAKTEIPKAKNHLKAGMERAALLKEGKTPWLHATGLVLRGYISKIDNSVQPYGLIIPANWKPDSGQFHRLDIWCHGRGETLSELNFVSNPSTMPPEFARPTAFVLFPYGRYCNANKFAGEIDVLEAMEHVKRYYQIDENRVVMRGFSMGGAACWQFAVHYPSLFCAAAPGAGFSETAKFLNVFQAEKVAPPEHEKKLWHLYDCPDYALNLYNLPTVAYSGADDKQKQAADVMAEALKQHNIDLVHIIGPKTGHSYEMNARHEINRRIDAIVAKGRDTLPKIVKFETYTLRYNRSFWIQIDGLNEHWSRGAIIAELHPDAKGDEPAITIQTSGITAFTIDIPAGNSPFFHREKVIVRIDGQPITFSGVKSDRSFGDTLIREGTKWKIGTLPNTIRKQNGLQGPIDDAFMDRFVMVKPTGQPLNDQIGKWVEAESKHAITHWRQQFRGEALVKNDTEINDLDITNSHLILWGDPSSNSILKKIIDKLPLTWTSEMVMVGNNQFDSKTHIPVLIFPNPLNPKKYVVLNSGFTYREYDYLNNARQVPKLPDWGIMDITIPINSRYAGKVAKAGFFDEEWKLKK